MEKIKYVYYQEGDLWVGLLETYPDYKSQWTTLEELEDNLRDVYKEINTGKIPHVRKIGELAIK